MNTITIECFNDSTKEYLESLYKDVHNHKGDSGFDLYCPNDMIIPANTYSNKIPLGIKTSIYGQSNYVGYMLLPRSSTGSKTPLRLSNSVGIIDRGYRGELMAVVDNTSSKDVVVVKGDRLFQLVPFCGNGISKVELGAVNETDRGSGGFGSTGK